MDFDFDFIKQLLKIPMNISKIVIALFVIVMLAKCTQKSVPYSYHESDADQPEQTLETEKQVAQEPVDIFADISTDSIKYYINIFIDSIARDELFKIENDYIFSKRVLPEMYKSGKNMLNWDNAKNRADAIDCLSNSLEDGLNPKDYHLKEINKLRESLLKNSFVDYKKIVAFDILLTDGLLLYTYHLIKGKIDPNSLDINWNFSSKNLPVNPTKLFQAALEENKIKEVVLNLRPKDRIYVQFISQLSNYQIMKDNGGWKSVNVKRVVKPGEFNNSLDDVRKRLFVTGDLEFEEGFMDTLYDDDMVAAVKRFQLRHGLTPDGVIGKNTLAAMNISIDHKINKLKLNMERARWVLNDISNELILVNIASFKLDYLHDSMRIHETKVMVGTNQHQTPIFKSKLKYLVFNPTWTVPYSIATRELLPKIKKNPSYLADRNISLLKGGKAIPQSSVDWTKITSQHFPYTLRQEPGPGNALGQVKFIFPNKYSVYLHDTPSKYLFVKQERAFSHGCIRVQNPLSLAEVLLNDKKWNMEKIQEVLDGKKEKVVHLKKPIDVLLLYWTCGFLEDGNIFFIEDVYNRDDKISAGLKNNNWEKLMRDYQKEIAKEQVFMK